jgi:hypothetical protein
MCQMASASLAGDVDAGNQGVAPAAQPGLGAPMAAA